MKVVAFNASPRKNANTMTMLDSIIQGASSQGAEVDLVHLDTLEMKGCIGCDACKQHLGRCVQKDDLSSVLEKIKEYDAIIIGTPVYFYHVSSQLKTLIDRLYSYYGYEHNPNTGEIKEKTAFSKKMKIVIATSRGDDENTDIFPELYDHLNEWLAVFAQSMNPESVEFLHQFGTWNEKDAARQNQELLDRAEALGKSLV